MKSMKFEDIRVGMKVINLKGHSVKGEVVAIRASGLIDIKFDNGLPAGSFEQDWLQWFDIYDEDTRFFSPKCSNVICACGIYRYDCTYHND